MWRILEEAKNKFLSLALAPNTIKLYNTGLRHYVRFCREMKFPLLPLNSIFIENFCVALSTRVRAKSIKNYLCGVQLFANINGDTQKFKDMFTLQYVIRGIKRSQGPWHKYPPKAPLTFVQLKQLLAHIKGFPDRHNRAMLRAVILMAFFGLLRVSEYTALSTTSFDPETNLCLRDISINFSRHILFVTIKASKTDPFREGLLVRLAATNHSICPVLAMITFLRVRGQHTGPLFCFQNRKFLTRNHIASLLHSCFPGVVTISSHSFRRGGASALAAAGVSQYAIQIFGRWRSDAFLRYVTLPDEFFTLTFADMARVADV